MEEYEAIKLARKIEWIIDKIHINVEWQIQDPLTQQEINDLRELTEDAETVVSWLSCNNSQRVLKIMGEHGILYLKLDEINHYYNFSEETRLSVARCMRTLLHANHLLYDSPTGETETIPKAGTKDEAEADSNVFLKPQKGNKTDFIRVINALYKLGFFCDRNNAKITKQVVFEEFGKCVNVNLSDYQNLLSKSKNSCNNDGNSQQCKIFEKMKEITMNKQKK